MSAQIRKIERQVDEDMVNMLAEILDMVKAGHVSDIVIVGNHAEDGEFFRSSQFSDRWRLLGALEYAKDAVQRG